MLARSRSTQSIRRSTRRRFAAVVTAAALVAASVALPADAYADVANPADPVVFGDAGLEACVVASLGIDPAVAVTQGDLARLTTLDCQASNLHAVSGLEFATNLTALNLADNAISDLSPLSTLTGLTDVVLTGQVLQLPDALAGEATGFPAVKDLHGDAVQVDVASDSRTGGTVINNVVTWSCTGAGRLAWLATIPYGNAGATTTFSGRMLQAVTQGAAPACPLTSAPKPRLTGTPRSGSTLTVSTGSWTPTTVALAIQWMRAGVAIAGATTKTYAVQATDAGKAITVRVTGSKPGYTTTATTSAALMVEKPLTASPTPTISGVLRVGSLLRASVGTWTPTGVTLAFRWKRNGVGIWGAASKTYTLVKADAGTRITFAVTGSKSGYTGVSRTSASSSIERMLLTSAPVPTVTGVAATARRLTAHLGTWGPSPVQLAFQWQRDHVDIPGATASTYVPSGPDVGKRIRLVVRGSKPGYYSQLRFSASTAAIVLSIPMPRDGTYRLGYNLSPGTYITRVFTTDCYWARLSGFDGSLNSMITYGFGNGQRIVTITANDAGFETRLCGTWIRLKDSPVSVKSTIPSEGVFSVGRQIKPGTYRAPGGNGCYWAALSSFDGNLGSIIDNDYSAYTGQNVSIQPGVVGFHTSGCGGWTRISD